MTKQSFELLRCQEHEQLLIHNCSNISAVARDFLCRGDIALFLGSSQHLSWKEDAARQRDQRLTKVGWSFAGWSSH